MGFTLKTYLTPRLRHCRLAFILLVLFLGTAHFTVPSFFKNVGGHVTKPVTADGEEPLAPVRSWPDRRLLGANESGHSSSYPEDLFTEEERRKGAVFLHIFGLIYMFIALAIVCDEFFVPSLEVITEKLGVSEDVAGATFMAAGGSAPELFTSLIGVFISQNDVGIGTIVGSAVFNILFVIGMCALCSRTLLTLTWWPLFRDVSFYSAYLAFLIVFFLDERIEWWESLILFICYFCYCTFMKFNVTLELKFKALLNRCCGWKGADPNVEKTEAEKDHVLLREFLLKNVKNIGFRGHGISLVRYSREHSRQLSSPVDILSPNNLINSTTKNDKHLPPGPNVNVNPMAETTVSSSPAKKASKTTRESVLHDLGYRTISGRNTLTSPQLKDLEDLDKKEPLDLSWPDSLGERICYIFLAPILVPLAFTLPDVRRPNRRIFFVLTFMGSILWIAFYSYNMVWWASVAGSTVGIPDEVMGLTILAAGTSVPDLITSVIVARKGFGDMALSSSVGSNLFDITVGLPVPWLLYSSVNSGAPYVVSSKGLLCSIFLLFAMLITVVLCIAVSGWKMNHFLGFSMLFLYLVFIVVAVMLEYSVLHCPSIS